MILNSRFIEIYFELTPHDDQNVLPFREIEILLNEFLLELLY